MKERFGVLLRHKYTLVVLGIVVIVVFAAWIYFHRPVDDTRDASQEDIDQVLKLLDKEDYDALLDMYVTADAMIDDTDLSDEDKEKKHSALKVYGDAIAKGKLSEAQGEEFADLIADIEEVASNTSNADAEDTADATDSTDIDGETTADNQEATTVKYDESYMDTDGNMHYTKKLSAEEFYQYEIRFKRVSKEEAQETLDQNIEMGWTEIYVPVDENGNYIDE